MEFPLAATVFAIHSDHVFQTTTHVASFMVLVALVK